MIGVFFITYFQMVTMLNILEKKVIQYLKMLSKWSNLKLVFPPTLIGAVCE